MTFTAYISGSDGIPRRVALSSCDRASAMIEAREIGQSLFRVFNFCVRSEQ